MSSMKKHILLIAANLLICVHAQEYDFAAEMTRQCLVPDPYGLLDCVENKVTLPYLSSWVECTNSLGQNVATSADIINYRCKSVWEGKGLIPEVFYIKDCVIEKTGLPAKNVSAEVLGAYKECENDPAGSQQKSQQQQGQGVKSAVQTQIRVAPPLQSSVQYQVQQTQLPTQFQGQQHQTPPQSQGQQSPVPTQFQGQQSQVPTQFQEQQSQVPTQFQGQQSQVPTQFQGQQSPVVTQYQVPVQFQGQQSQVPVQFQGQQYQVPVQFQGQQSQVPVQFQGQQYQVPVQFRGQHPVAPTQLQGQQFPFSTQYQTQPQYHMPYQIQQPHSQQFFAIYPRAPLPQQYNVPSTIQQPYSYGLQSTTQSAQMMAYTPPANGAYYYGFTIQHPVKKSVQ